MFVSTLSKCIVPIILLSVSLANATKVGDRLDYVLNNDNSRTSRMVKEGEASSVVSAYANGFYTMTVNYSVTVRPNRNKSGNVSLDIPESTFEPDFYDRLREAGSMDFDMFSIEYLGTSDATDADDNAYEGCHNIRMYNIDMDRIDKPGRKRAMADISDLELNMKICDGIPGNGAAQLDVSGRVFGISVKIGFDYTQAY